MVGTIATGPGSVVSKLHAPIITAAEKGVYGVATFTYSGCIEYQICPSDVANESTTHIITNMNGVTDYLKRVDDSNTSNEQKRMKMESSIFFTKFDASFKEVYSQELWKTIQ